MTSTARLQLSLSDIARLADVRRPVVSTWRRRPLRGHTFPSPVDVVRGEEQFDAEEVAAYLAATSRGNNPEVIEDLAAHARLARTTTVGEDMVTMGLTALLCLTAQTDEPLADLSPVELRALARAIDPEDTFVVREVEALGDDVGALAAHADQLASASYSPQAAFERLLRRSAAATYPGHWVARLAEPAQALVARTAAALTLDADAGSPTLVDVTDSSGDLLLATVNGHADGLNPRVATLLLDTPVTRLARRRLRLHDVTRLDVVRDAAGDFTVVGGEAITSVHVLHVPPAGEPGLSDLEVLDLVGNLAIQLDDDSRAVVIGPASALIDSPATAALDQARDGVIRGDRLRAAIRLPAGLLPHSPRRHLGLWVLGPAHPQVAVRDRWTAVADVSDQALDESLIDAIVVDAVAAMTPDERSAKGGIDSAVVGSDAGHVIGHQFRVARRVRTSLILPRRSSLMARVRSRGTTVSSAEAAELAARVERLVADLSPSSLDRIRVSARQVDDLTTRVGPGASTVEQAIEDRYLELVAGSRVREADIVTGSEGLPLVGPAEILSGPPERPRRVDAMTFGSHYPSGQLTKSGDVVVCASPRVGAVVDTAGSSVVQTPARVLRITDEGQAHLVPAVLAADVSMVQGTGIRDLRRWPIRVLAHDVVEALAATVPALDQEREMLLARIAALDDLSTHLFDGAASGALTITSPGTTSPTTIATEGH